MCKKAIMDHHEKCFLLLQLCIFLLIQPSILPVTSISSQAVLSTKVSKHSSTLTKSDRHSNSRQFYLPVVLWPYHPHYPILVPHPYNGPFQPYRDSSAHYSQAQAQHHPSSIFALKSDLEPAVANHANEVGGSLESDVVNSCNTRDNQLGKCMHFKKCFPMLDVENRNDDENGNGSENYMDLPLQEQLLHNTNSSKCSQDEGKENGSTTVCCPVEFRYSFYDEINGIGDDTEVPTFSITQRPPLRKKFLQARQLNTDMCGQSKLLLPRLRVTRSLSTDRPTLKITGGQNAKGPLEFPWMAGIFGKNKKLFCGASLITHQFLLTAAHCFSTFMAEDVPHLYVHLGDYDLRTTSDGPHQVRKIEKIILNKGFRIENYHNDIALIKLDRPVNFTERILPICLPKPTMESLEQRQVTVTGWGRKYRYGTLSDVLRKVDMPVWNLDQCKSVYSTFAPGRVLDSNICAGDGKRNKDACIGDSGGPAVAFEGDRWVQFGITSWGKGCGSFPGVYTRVDKHLMWITKNLNLYS